MPFSQDGISDAKAVRDDAELLVTWSSTQPDGTVYQVYLDGRLVYRGTALFAVLPYPGNAGALPLNFDVGWVDPDEEFTDFSAVLPALPYEPRALVRWIGGTWETPTGTPLAGFNVYRSAAAGDFVGYGDGGYGDGGYSGVNTGDVNYTTPVATVSAYAANVVTDGYGDGGYDEGTYGSSSARYEYESEPLPSGVWTFGVRPFDAAGNEGDPLEAAVAITSPPAIVPPNASGQRLTYTYDKPTRTATLHWLASAG